MGTLTATYSRNAAMRDRLTGLPNGTFDTETAIIEYFATTHNDSDRKGILQSLRTEIGNLGYFELTAPAVKGKGPGAKPAVYTKRDPARSIPKQPRKRRPAPEPVVAAAIVDVEQLELLPPAPGAPLELMMQPAPKTHGDWEQIQEHRIKHVDVFEANRGVNMDMVRIGDYVYSARFDPQ